MNMRFSFSAAVLLSALLCGGCKERSEEHQAKEGSVQEAESGPRAIPRTLNEALDRLDERASEDVRDAIRNDELGPSSFHHGTGTGLRNEWGLWSGSDLKDYFSDRGIAHADWISSAIFEAWFERLKTGSVDEDAIIAKYAKIEKDWREQWENPDSHVPADDGFDPFSEDPAEPQR